MNKNRIVLATAGGMLAEIKGGDGDWSLRLCKRPNKAYRDAGIDIGPGIAWSFDGPDMPRFVFDEQDGGEPSIQVGTCGIFLTKQAGMKWQRWIAARSADTCAEPASATP